NEKMSSSNDISVSKTNESGISKTNETSISKINESNVIKITYPNDSSSSKSGTVEITQTRKWALLLAYSQ
ncbi:13229_t:CDS:1, partial [Ambispora leptoticha]